MEEGKRKALNELLEQLTTNLDISDTEDEYIRQSYKAVGEWLSAQNSILNKFDVEIRPQGSFNLGTIIRPTNDDDDIDIDLVCELKGKEEEWTQENVKDIVGKRLKDNDTYKKMLDEEGRRCWTLLYREGADKGRYHMDVLPCVINKDYGNVIREMYRNPITDNYDWDKVAIRITDRERKDYKISTNVSEWLKSNPFGYARWFTERAKMSSKVRVVLNEGVKPLPTKSKDKLPLQKVVQILKRHRDIYYGGNDDKPISIIITTLAAKAYNGEADLATALTNVVRNFDKAITEEWSQGHGKWIKVISNPVNPEENFADKWPENPNKEKIFYEWMRKLATDILSLENQTMIQLGESFKKHFGKAGEKVFRDNATTLRANRENGNLKMASTTGILSTTAGNIAVAAAHSFYGKESDGKDTK